jgi:hypothetical protein
MSCLTTIRSGMMGRMESDEMRELAEIIARRLLPEGADRETARVGAYLQGNCTECFTAPIAEGLPNTVTLCEPCANYEGWVVCYICGKWECDWHRWYDGEPECTACLKLDNAAYVTNPPWLVEDCDCDRCFWLKRAGL